MSTLIKICGLTSRTAIDAAIAAGASHIGLVHFDKSPRHVSLEQAAELADYAGDFVETVLLLVNMEKEPTLRAIDQIRPDVVQFHGSETPEWLNFLRQHTPLEIWKAFGVRDADGLNRARKYEGAAHRILYDAPAAALPGGTGARFDWSLLAHHSHGMEWGLAGGLSPDNVEEALIATHAPLVDVSSGVESAPGLKDVAKIAAFCEAVRRYDTR
jgi:phosphoribosylanthranilate isomerase